MIEWNGVIGQPCGINPFLKIIAFLTAALMSWIPRAAEFKSSKTYVAIILGLITIAAEFMVLASNSLDAICIFVALSFALDCHVVSILVHGKRRPTWSASQRTLLVVVACLLFFPFVSKRMRWSTNALDNVCRSFRMTGNTSEGVPNNDKTYSYSHRFSGNGVVILTLKDLRSGALLAELNTGASCYHRFGFRWLTSNRVLMKSSDIGYKTITVGDECKSYPTLVKYDGDCAELQAVDEDYKPLFSTKVDKSFLNWEGFTR